MNRLDKSIITGLFLSQHDQNALIDLGFKTFQESFNVLGYSLGTKPASIKNYRDEFDSLFPNNRKGWHKRPIRSYCKVYFDQYSNLNFEEFSSLVKSFLIENYEIEKFVKKIERKDFSETVAKRLFTGKAAEEYFKSEYKKIQIFSPLELTDTTNMGCGFDFKLSLETNFYCIEVKGLNELKGSILLTEKEFYMAQNMKENYCLFIVKNFKEKPQHDIVFDPLNSRLAFKEIKSEIIQTNFRATI